MRKALFFAICTSALLAFSVSSYAQTGRDGTKVITTAAPFLSVGPDSRAGGMGETGVAITDDANAMHWNPSAFKKCIYLYIKKVIIWPPIHSGIIH